MRLKKRPPISVPYWAAMSGVVGAVALNLGIIILIGHETGIGAWRLLAILLLVSSVGVGVAGLIQGKRRSRKATFSLGAALLLSPLGLNAAEVGPAPYSAAGAEPVASEMVISACGAPVGVAAAEGLLPAQGSAVWCVISLLGIVAATGGCILAIATMMAAPVLSLLLIFAVRAVCVAGTVAAILAAALTCLDSGGGGRPPKPELDV